MVLVVMSGGEVVFVLVRRPRKDYEEFVSLMSCCRSIFFRGLEREG